MSSPGVLELKRRALAAKRSGNVEEAKEFLQYAKQLEKGADLKKLAVICRKHNCIEAAKEALLKIKELESNKPVEDPVNKAIDEANLDELNGTVSFADEEMLDVETMQDMKDNGLDIPTIDKYQERATACRRDALNAKNQGNAELAKSHLRKSKQFEAAIEKLFPSGKVELEEDDGEDYSLLDELMENGGRQYSDDGFVEQLFGDSSNVIELDDLDDLDAAMLRDMMEAGMEIPNVDEVLNDAKEKKAMALSFKKDGNLVAAKSALEEAKRLESKANQLSGMLVAIERGDVAETFDDPEAMLEAMLNASEPSSEKKKKKPAKKNETEEPEQLKSSEEYKVQAVNFKKNNQLEEAVAALKLYKRALAAEASAKKAQRKLEDRQTLEKEVEFAKSQYLLFSFYQRFVDECLGKAQLEFWREYQMTCEKALKQDGVEISRSTEHTAKQICDNLSFVGRVMDSKEQRIEITILELIDVQENKSLKEALSTNKKPPKTDSIRLDVTCQLPPNSTSMDVSSTLMFQPESHNESYSFGSSQYVSAERGESRFAKSILRKIGRKRIVFDVFYVQKGILWSSGTEVHLGAAVVELKDLLTTNWIAGDFPLLDASRRRKVGGLLRLAVRTGVPFQNNDDSKPEELSVRTGLSASAVKLEPFAPLTVAMELKE